RGPPGASAAWARGARPGAPGPARHAATPAPTATTGAVRGVRAVRAVPWVDAGLPGLLDELAALPAPFVIVLDDYHHLLGGQAEHDLVDLLVARLPPTVQLAVATRSGTRLPLARLRATGALLE